MLTLDFLLGAQQQVAARFEVHAEPRLLARSELDDAAHRPPGRGPRDPWLNHARSGYSPPSSESLMIKA